MARSAHLPIAADRYEPCVRKVIFRGLDLRDVPLRMQVRSQPDVPGEPLVDLQSTTNGNAEGLRLIDFAVVGAVPVSTIELVINETTMEALPYRGELGSPTPLAYDMQATIAGRKRKLIWGAFVVLAGVTGADNAPTGRLPDVCGSAATTTWSTATFTITDDAAEVSLAGIDLIDDLLAGLITQREDERARMVARALLYGIADLPQARLFASEATEIAFADDYYRDGFAHQELSRLPGWEVYNGPAPIDGRGLLVTGDMAAGILQPAPGDVTVIVEADLPAGDGSLRTLACYVGADLFNRVAVNRNEIGFYTLQLYHPVDGLKLVAGPQDTSARRMRVAFSIGRQVTRVSFAGGAVLSIASRRPDTLLRLWFGRSSLGTIDQIDGRVLRAAIYPLGVSDELLRTMSGGPVTDDEVTNLIDEKIRTHDNDRSAHELEVLRRQAELADSKTGLWTVAAADSFTGADGALTTAPTGGQAWTGGGISRIGNQARSTTGALGGVYLVANVPEGQVEADLAPGNSEASLYLRYQSNGNYLLLQRKPDGFVGLYRFVAGASTIISPPSLTRAVVAGERFKARLIGPRIWVFRVAGGVEELLFDVVESAFQTSGSHGLRLNGTGAADNFRILSREAL